MKQFFILFFFAFLFSIKPVDAQPYKSIFGNQSTSWVYVWGDMFGKENDTVSIVKDTLVNGIIYKKLNWFESLYREDTMTGTVWCRTVTYDTYPDDTLERVVSRMDLNVGDTFDISNIRLHKAGTQTEYYSRVDSIRYHHGLKHIYFEKTYENYNEPYTLIEGVGSNMGIFWKYAIYHVSYGDGGYYLLCSYKDGQKTGYENRAFNGICWQYSDVPSMPKEEAQEIIIYPQPAHDVVHFQTKFYRIASAMLMNLTGQIVKQVYGADIKMMRLDGANPGNYLLQLRLQDNSKHTFLLTVQ